MISIVFVKASWKCYSLIWLKGTEPKGPLNSRSSGLESAIMPKLKLLDDQKTIISYIKLLKKLDGSHFNL